jgi:hypothetical protein
MDKKLLKKNTLELPPKSIKLSSHSDNQELRLNDSSEDGEDEDRIEKMNSKVKERFGVV